MGFILADQYTTQESLKFESFLTRLHEIEQKGEYFRSRLPSSPLEQNGQPIEKGATTSDNDAVDRDAKAVAAAETERERRKRVRGL